MRPLFESPAFSLHYEAAHHWLTATWHGKPTAEIYLSSRALILHFTSELHCTLLLCDASESLDGWEEIGRWLSTSYLSFLTESGMQAIAWVNAHDWYRHERTEELMRKSTEPFMATFDEGSNAYDWLHRVCYLAPEQL
ncbi:hypothetical protein [Hymenobacter crusticola]|uniref:STAS/SEC14 domain-containing protein n=1 Tax=Hymenobacter crusticola TaxID=1770526 RepID=A0A243W4U3_9BACT|nr:hypothetical protein [Hymenobacter crusticola]OUJ67350.1 hypothetical protein BXP70_28900 [Hymenobacter crusticola]